MTSYRHTQVGWTILVSVGIAILLICYFGTRSSDWAALATVAILVMCLVLFASLTVAVNDNSVQIRFGIGLIRRRFSFSELERCEVVKNRWWYGWGIRRIPRGWLFNVSGLDAVELSMRNGRVHRIGTDEPQKLHQAIQMRLGGSGQ